MPIVQARVVGVAALLLAGCSAVPLEPHERLGEVPAGGAVTVESEDWRARLAEARSKLADGDPAGAAVLARSLVEQEPAAPAARIVLGEALLALPPTAAPLQLDTRGEAETHLLAAAKLAPAAPEAHDALGRLYENDGHFEAALASYGRALEVSALYRPSLVAAARLATELGQERRAIRHLEALRALQPLPADALVWEARCYLTLAESAALTGSPDALQRNAWLRRARRAFIELGERESSDPRAPAGEAHCSFLLALDSPDKIADDEKRHIRALYQKAARLAPADPLPRYNLARFLESRLVADATGAIEEYKATLARDPLHLPSLLNLARLLWLAGKRDAARVYYRQALPLVEDDGERSRIERLLAAR